MLNREELEKQAKKDAPAFKTFYRKNKKKIEKMDDLVHNLHEEIVECTDCLECANCCRSLGPAIHDKDIERLAKVLKMKPSELVSTYLKVDEDGDYVFSSMPCPFLMPDNYCSVYESRPKACREYPHTDRKRFFQIYNLTVKNSETCPVAYGVLKRLTE
jgi:Predicted Fe-S-cluster oxidoreductase